MVFERSIQLAKACLHVLRKDKEILLLPLLAAGTIILILLPYALSIIFYPNLLLPLLILIPVLPFLLAFITVFFQAAVVGMTIIRIDGGDPKIRDGLRTAASRAWPLFLWAVIGVIVGVILGIIRSKFQPQTPIGFASRPSFVAFSTSMPLGGPTSPPQITRAIPGWGIGDILGGALGMAWSVATFFVIPIILQEKISPLRAVERSLGIIRRVWKDTLILQLGFGAVFFLLGLFGVIFVLSGVYAADLNCVPNPATQNICGGVPGDLIVANPAPLIVGVGVAVVYWAALAAVNFALKGILRGTLYSYSRKETLEISGPEGFSGLKGIISSLRG